MTTWPILSRAPIREALVDLQVRPSGHTDLEACRRMGEEIGADYPQRTSKHEWRTRIEVAPDSTPAGTETTGGPIGFAFSTPDGRRVVQARTNGFTFNRLHPYSDWREFLSEAELCWHLYAKNCRPETVTRIALRFINLIPLPLPVSDLKDFLLTGPEIAPGLPQELLSYFFRTVTEWKSSDAVAVVTQNVEAQAEGDMIPVLFDIDVYRVGEFDPKDDGIWSKLDELRDIKNKIFFESLTPRTIDLFR